MQEQGNAGFKIIIAVILAVVSGLLATTVLTDSRHSMLVGIIVLLVTLWTNEGLSLGVVSLLPLMLFPSFDVLSLKSTSSYYANPVIFLFLGGFMLAIAVQKTGLHQFLAQAMMPKSARTARSIIFPLGLVAAVLSSLLSNTTTALLLLPVAIFLSDERVFQARFVLAIAYGASIGGIMTPIGTPPNLILMGFLESQGLPSIAFVKWMFLTMPLAVVMLAIMPWVLSLGLPKEHGEFAIHGEKPHMTAEQRKLAWVLALLGGLLLLNSRIEPWYPGLGMDDKMIMLGFGLLMFVPGMNFLSWEDTRRIPYEIIFLFGAGFSIAGALVDSGLAQVIAQSLEAFAQFHAFFIILVIAALITFSTEITSNTALVSLAVPIIYSLGQLAETSTVLILMVAAICGSYAFMLPIATPPNAIAMSSGALRVKEMMTLGLVFNLLGITFVTLTAWFFWRWFL